MRVLKFQILSGLLFAAVCIVGMLNSLELQPGIFFDGRSIVLTLAGAFGGPLAAAIAAVISASYRLLAGGPGTLMGVLVIIVSALSGVGMYLWSQKKPGRMHPAHYYFLGLAVHCVVLALSFTLPDRKGHEIFPVIALPILLIFPIANWMVAWLLLAQEKQINTIASLKESEKRFRLIFQNSLAIYLLIDPDDASVWDANQAAVDFYGYPLKVLKTMKMHQINISGKQEVMKAVDSARKGQQSFFSFKHRLADGSLRDVEILSGPIVIRNKTLLLSTIQDITGKKQASEALNRERSLLRTLIDNIPDRVSVKDASERRILSNLSELLFLGKGHEEVFLKKDTELLGGQIGKQIEEDDRKVLSTGIAIINKEEKLPAHNGEASWTLSSRIPLRDEQNKIIGLITISRDITQRRQAEEKIRNLSLVAQSTSNLVLISDKHDKIIWVNTSFLTRTGYSLQEVLGQNAGQLLQGPDTDAAHVESIARAAAAKQSIRQEILNYTKAGEKIWLEVYMNPVLDSYGEIEKYISISVDITERKHTELLLQQSIKSYSDLFNSLDEAIYIQDAQGRIQDMNQGAIKMYGYTLEEVVGKNPDFLAAPGKNNMPRVYDSILEAYNGKIQKLEFHGKKKNGVEFPKEVHLYPGEYFSQKVVLAVAQDISERRHSQELQNSLEVAQKTAQLKQQFLANVSHEMRTPMNGVLGMTGILKKTPLDARQSQYLQIIEDSSRSMLEIINDVLQLSRIEAGKQEVFEHVIQTAHFGERIQSLFAEIARSKNLSFSIECKDNMPGHFISDETKLLQVITNLVGNSLKFTNQGHIKLILETFVSHEQKNMMRFSVKDTGKGISPEYHEKIFEEFAQVDPSPTRESGGTGLGLAISKRMAELLGGTIGVVSEPEKGSTFWFTFSYKKAQAPFPEKNVPDPEPAVDPLGLSILLVEDKKVNQMVAKLILKDLGCKVDIAENGLKAIEKVQQNHYDVVFMDIQMPVMDGVTAVRKLRAMDIPLPVIIGLSAEAMEGDAEKYISLGMDDYLTKPVDGKIILQKLNSLKSKN